MNIDPVALENERFSLTPERARAMLTKKGKLRVAYRYQPRKALKSQPKPDVEAKKMNIQPQVKTRIAGVNLTEAQERAFNNYLEGILRGNTNDV